MLVQLHIYHVHPVVGWVIIDPHSGEQCVKLAAVQKPDVLFDAIALFLRSDLQDRFVPLMDFYTVRSVMRPRLQFVQESHRWANSFDIERALSRQVRRWTSYYTIVVFPKRSNTASVQRKAMY